MSSTHCRSAKLRRRVLLLVAILCFVVFFLSRGKRNSIEETGARVTEWSVGLSFSPWWTYYRRTSPDGSFEFRSGVQALSWSWLFLIGGGTALSLRRRLARVESMSSDSAGAGTPQA